MQTQDPRIDRCRGAVYQAEDTVTSVMRRPHRTVRIGSSVVTLPPEVRFGSLAGIQSFVDEVLTDPRTTTGYPDRGPVLVRPRRGFRAATYSGGVIHIPAADPRGRWALSRAVVLHEVAHHLAAVPGHGGEFRSALVHLYALHMGGAADLLRHLLAPLDALPDPNATRVADGTTGAEQLRRVAALLAKASSTESADEAEAYLAKAAVLAQRHSVDLAVAAMAGRTAAQLPTHRMVTIGEPRRALNKILVALFVSIARSWSVTVDIGHGSTYVLGYGMPRDLDQVESVFATASTMMISRAHDHVSGGSWRGTTYVPNGARAARPVTAGVARTAFCLGFVERLGQRLQEGARSAREATAPTGRAAAATEAGGPTQHEVALALRERDRAVTQYYREASTARGSWRGSASAAGSAVSSRRAGRRAAEEYGRRGIAGRQRAIGS